MTASARSSARLSVARAGSSSRATAGQARGRHPRRDAGAGRARATDPGPPGIDADHLEAGAPPEELGRSDFTLDHDEALVDRDEHEAALDDEEAAELAEEQAYEEIEDWEMRRFPRTSVAEPRPPASANPATRSAGGAGARRTRRTSTARA